MRMARSHFHFLGLRVVALAETCAFLALALAFDHYLGSGDRFAGVVPHPFWAIVLLVSAQYGAKEGLAAALMASAALLAGNLPEQEFSEDLYAWLLRATTEPILWTFAAIGIGEIRDSHRRERDALREDLREAREHAQALGHAYEQLLALKDHLEARVAGQVRTVHSIFQATRGIERQDTGEVLAGVQQLVAGVMHPRKFSLFLVGERGLEAAFSEGWADADGYAAEFDRIAPLFQAVVSHRRILVATRPSHGLILGTEGLLAGPLTNPESGEVIGMLKIEAMDFLDLNPASVETFQVLCNWIGAAFVRAQHWEESEAARYYDQVRQLLPAPLFEIQRGISTVTAERLGHDLCALYVGLDLPENAPSGMQAAAARVVSRVAASLLSPAEPRFDWRRDGWDVVILLPGADTLDAEGLARGLHAMIVEAMADAGLDVALRMEVEPLHQHALRAPRSTAA